MEDGGLRSVGWEVGEDIEQVLAADADGVFDLSPATVVWLLETLDAVTTAPDAPASSSV